MNDWLQSRAKQMRREPVHYERRLWGLLRDRRLAGLKFRRQMVIGRYIVDFVCLRHRLIVEADGNRMVDDGVGATDAWAALTRGRLRHLERLGLATPIGRRCAPS